MIGPLSWVLIYVADVDKVRPFYENVLKLPLKSARRVSPRLPNSFIPRSSSGNGSRPRSSTTSPSAARRKRR